MTNTIKSEEEVTHVIFPSRLINGEDIVRPILEENGRLFVILPVGAKIVEGDEALNERVGWIAHTGAIGGHVAPQTVSTRRFLT